MILNLKTWQNSSDVGPRMLQSSQSCLALCEINEANHNIGSDSMSVKALGQSYSDSALRDANEHGLNECEVEIATEATRPALQLSFTSLPPLEQRRQRRMRDLFEFLKNITNGFHELVKKLQLVMKEVFSNIIPNELAIRRFQICKIENLFKEISDHMNARKVLYNETKSSEEQVHFYIEHFGSSLFTKLENLVSMYDGLETSDVAKSTKEELNNAVHVQEAFQDASIKIQEHFTRLQLLIKYVLYCTPRQHIDHRPLSLIYNELNRINQRKCDKSKKQASEKDAPLPVDTSNGGSNKKKKTKISRRYSLDSSALKKLNFMSRGVSFGRKSSQPFRKNSEHEFVEKCIQKQSELTDSHDAKQFPTPWHSSPYNQKNEIIGFRNCTAIEDKETSFDGCIFDSANGANGLLNGSCNLQDSSKNSVERKCSDQSYKDSRQISGQLSAVNSRKGSGASGSISNKVNSNSFYDICDGVGERSDGSMPFCSSNQSSGGCDLELRTKMGAKSLRNCSKEDSSESPAMHQSCCYSECNQKTGGKAVVNGNQLHSVELDQVSKKNCLSQSRSCDVPSTLRKYDRKRSGQLFSTAMPLLHQSVNDPKAKESSCESSGDGDQLISIRGCSPTLLKRQYSQHHSPTLLNDLETSVYFYPVDNDPIPDQKLDTLRRKEKEVNRNVVAVNPKPVKAERENFVFCKDESVMSRPDLYKSDKSLYPDNRENKYHKGKNENYRVRNNLPRDSETKGLAQLGKSRGAQYRAQKSAVLLAREKSSGGQSSEKCSPGQRNNQKSTCEMSVFEESNTSIKSTVARARKRLKNLASPRVFRKKDTSIDASSKKTDAQLKRESDAPLLSVSSSRDLSHDKYAEFYGGKQASFSSVDSSFDQPLNVGSIERLRNTNGNYQDIGYKYQEIETGNDSSAKITPKLRRGLSSPSNDLSISSDFHSTVTQILRSNSISAGSPVRVGFSTFYYKAETDTVRMRVGSSSGSDDLLPIQGSDAVEKRDNVLSEGSSSTKYLSPDSNLNADRSGESATLSRKDYGCNPEQQAKPIRLSRSEPLIDNNESVEKVVTNGTVEPHRNLQSFRKIPKTRISSWSKNFDLLLSDKVGVKVFAEFLRSEYSEENLRFWLACENFKTLKGSKVAKTAQKIYKSFIEICSTNEVNLDHHTRAKIRQSLLSPSKNMFNTAQSRIKELMAQDSYQRFIKSQMYESLLML